MMPGVQDKYDGTANACSYTRSLQLYCACRQATPLSLGAAREEYRPRREDSLHWTHSLDESVSRNLDLPSVSVVSDLVTPRTSLTCPSCQSVARVLAGGRAVMAYYSNILLQAPCVSSACPLVVVY